LRGGKGGTSIVGPGRHLAPLRHCFTYVLLGKHDAFIRVCFENSNLLVAHAFTDGERVQLIDNHHSQCVDKPLERN